MVEKIVKEDKKLGPVDGYGFRDGSVTQENGVGRAYMGSRFSYLNLDDVDSVVAVSPHPDDAALGLNGLLWNIHQKDLANTYKYWGRDGWLHVRKADEGIPSPEKLRDIKRTKLYLVDFSYGWAGTPGKIADRIREELKGAELESGLTPEECERRYKIDVRMNTERLVCDFLDMDAHLHFMNTDADMEDWKLRSTEKQYESAVAILNEALTDKTLIALPHLGETHGTHKLTTGIFWKALAEVGKEKGVWPRVIEYSVWTPMFFANRFLPVNWGFTDRLIGLYDDQSSKFAFANCYKEMTKAKQMHTAALIENEGRRHLEQPIGFAEPYIALETEEDGKLDNRFVKLRAETGVESGFLMELVSRGICDNTVYEFADALKNKGVSAAAEVLKNAELQPIKSNGKTIKRNPLPPVMLAQVPIYLD
jgi:LmbE family N-acetylglucosaminyl deacetylase